MVSGPLHTRDWEPVTITFQALSLVEMAELVQAHLTLRLRDPCSMWMQDGCKVYVDSYMASNGSCFMVNWTILKNHFLEVALTQNQGTMALWALTTIDLFYFIMREDLHDWKFIEIAFGWETGHIMTSHCTWGSVTTLHDLGGELGRPLETFFGALIMSWSRLLTRVWSGPQAI